jgi:hypothetical protein
MTVTVKVAVLPASTVMPGEMEIPKSKEVTVSWIAAVLDLPPPVPVMVNGYVPEGVAVEVVMVRLDVKLGVPDCGLKTAVTPAGNPEIERATDWAVP